LISGDGFSILKLACQAVIILEYHLRLGKSNPAISAGLEGIVKNIIDLNNTIDRITQVFARDVIQIESRPSDINFTPIILKITRGESISLIGVPVILRVVRC
jgi:hypothetical protein